MSAPAALIRRARITALDDQVAAVLRDLTGQGRPRASRTGEVWAALGWEAMRPRPAEYTDVYRSLRRMETAGTVIGLRDPVSKRRGGVWWLWRGLP